MLEMRNLGDKIDNLEYVKSLRKSQICLFKFVQNPNFFLALKQKELFTKRLPPLPFPWAINNTDF